MVAGQQSGSATGRVVNDPGFRRPVGWVAPLEELDVHDRVFGRANIRKASDLV
jgi:hypothetical protein